MTLTVTAGTLAEAIKQLPANSKPLSATRIKGVWAVTVEVK